jgi:hypothetical protein
MLDLDPLAQLRQRLLGRRGHALGQRPFEPLEPKGSVVALDPGTDLAPLLSSARPRHIGLAHRNAPGHLANRTVGCQHPIPQILLVSLPSMPPHEPPPALPSRCLLFSLAARSQSGYDR